MLGQLKELIYKKGKIISHKDLDGVGAVVVAKTYLNIEETVYTSNRSKNEKIEEAIEELKDNLYDYLLITDLSPSNETVSLVDNAVKEGFKIFVVDHHKTALDLNEYEWATVEVADSNEVLNSGTSLLYVLFKLIGLKGTDELDLLTEKIRRYDTWHWTRLNDEVPNELNSLLWMFGVNEMESRLLLKLKHHDDIITNMEKELLIIEKNRVALYVEGKKKSVKFAKYNEHTVGYVFAENYINDVATMIYNDFDVDLAVVVGFDTFSLRTNKEVDVSAIASKFNGGGHPKASGFTVDEEIKKSFLSNFFTEIL